MLQYNFTREREMLLKKKRERMMLLVQPDDLLIARAGQPEHAGTSVLKAWDTLAGWLGCMLPR